LDEFVPIKRIKYQAMIDAIAVWRKDAGLDIPINRQNLEKFKKASF
jgi:hypothetical protein